MNRTVTWEGIHNCRDLGGLPLPGGGQTAWQRFYRAPRLDVLTGQGWSDLIDAGVSTVIDLRNADEIAALGHPESLTRHTLPIEDQTDKAFMADWGELLASPRYYRAALERWPEKFAAVFTTMATAPPGGIVFHCSAGRDRTGLITAMLLRLVDVEIDVIVDDYELNLRAMNDHYATQENPREQPLEEPELVPRISRARKIFEDFLSTLDVDDYLATAGVSGVDLARLQDRLVTLRVGKASDTIRVPRIRRITSAADAAPIARIHVLARQAYYRAAGVELTRAAPEPDEARIAMWRDFIADPAKTVLAADNEGTTVAFCAWAATAKAFAVTPGAVELLALYVDPEHWGQGAGGLLHDRFSDHLSGSGAPCGALEVWERNERAIAFYNRRGWSIQDGTRPGPMDAPFLTLRLEPPTVEV